MSIDRKVSQVVRAIDPGISVGMVSLRVSDLERSRRFYEGLLGFQPLEQRTNSIVLGGQDRQPLLELIEVPGAGPQPRRATGLYHVAILFPTRADLGHALTRLNAVGWQIGQGDHLVSEALYISDPDSNGLELYRDRPRETWHWKDGLVEMATDPVDLVGLIEEAKREAKAWEILPEGTRVGHIHLQVGDIEEAERFYHTILGFDITAYYAPGALFVSVGGYHHHIGLNTWNSLHAKPTPATSAGLESYRLLVPSQQGLLIIKERLTAYGVPFEEHEDHLQVNDPWNNRILFVVPAN